MDRRVDPATSHLKTGEERGRGGAVSYLEGRGRVWVHLDQGCDQDHAGEISGPFAGGQDGDSATLRKNEGTQSGSASMD